MTLTEILKFDLDVAYSATEGLMKLVDADALDWKPATGSNWMTTGQLLHHCTLSCGQTIKGFVTGEWGQPAGASIDELSAEDMLPPADSLPTVESIDGALRALAEDKALALHYIEDAGDVNLSEKRLVAPWGGPEAALFQHFAMSIAHLTQHKGQLFYYLKLQGQDINTAHLWGM